MTLKKLTTLCLVALSSLAFAQATMTNGPELENDRDNKMNRMLGGDDNSYFCYRVRSKGKGTSFFIEKYDKTSLKPLFSKEISLEEENRTKIEDVFYTNGKIYIGSTCVPYLSTRLAGHTTHYNQFKKGLRTNLTSFQIIEMVIMISFYLKTILVMIKTNYIQEKDFMLIV